MEFELHAIYEDGSRARVEAEWSLLNTSFANIDDSGVFTARGDVGGQVRVEARAVGMSLSTLATVQVIWPTHQGAVPASIGERFDEQDAEQAGSLDPARTIEILYPLANAVMPANIAAPNVQWRGALRGDRVRVVVERPHARIEMFGDAAQDSFVPSSQSWRSLIESDQGTEIQVRVDRLDLENRLWFGESNVLHLTDDAIQGVLYYYEIYAPEGLADAIPRIVRVHSERPGVREVVVPAPPTPFDWMPVDSVPCTGCHDIARNGMKMAALSRFHAVYDLREDLSQVPAPTVFQPNDARWGKSASFDPSAALLIVTDPMELGDEENTFLGLIDAESGELIPSDFPIEPAAQIQWSPD